MYSENFEKAFEELIGLEGGYVNDNDDPGGETKFGISKRSYPSLEIASLTLETAKSIYFRDFWKPLRGDSFQQSLSFELFEQSVNFGTKQAVLNVQYGLQYLGEDIRIDGIFGNGTQIALLKWQSEDLRSLLKVLNGVQFVKYFELVRKNPKLSRFAKGWLKRIS